MKANFGLSGIHQTQRNKVTKNSAVAEKTQRFWLATAANGRPNTNPSIRIGTQRRFPSPHRGGVRGGVYHTESTEITEKLRQRFPSPWGGREGAFPFRGGFRRGFGGVRGGGYLTRKAQRAEKQRQRFPSPLAFMCRNVLFLAHKNVRNASKASFLCRHYVGFM